MGKPEKASAIAIVTMPTRKIGWTLPVSSTLPHRLHPSSIRHRCLLGIFVKKRGFAVMKRRFIFLVALLALLSGLTVAFSPAAHAETQSSHIPTKCIVASSTNVLTGNIGGANYLIEVPSNWNGTLVLYSHVYRGRALLSTSTEV